MDESRTSKSGCSSYDAMDLCSTAAPKGKRSWALLSGLPRKREAVRQFTPSWFTVTMGTGSVAITLGTFPYAFTGQQAIAWATWWLTALLFVFFCIMLLGRALLFSSTLPHLFRHPNQSLFLGAVPMSVSTLTNGLVLFWIPRFGAAAGVAAHAMFWVNLPGVLGCILLVPLFMFTRHEHGLHTMSALWLLPVVPACVAANTAGVLASKMADSGHALVVFYLGVCLLGVGFMLSHQICTIYYLRLTFHSLPARELIISSFLPVGPMAMTAWALLNLGTAGGVQLEAYYSKHFDPTIDVQWLHDVAVRMAAAAAAGLGLFLWGYATWWLLLALASVGTCLRKGIPFNLGWWGAIFPMGVYTGATTQLGHAAHSNTFLVFGAIATYDQVAQFQAEYQAAFQSGSQDELEAAKCRLIWALVHSTTRSNQQRGLELAQAALDNDQRSQDQDRELRYYQSVALFLLGRCLDARRTLTTLLQEYPDFRQAESLKQEVDDRVVRDGLFGLGVAGAVAAVALGVIFGAGKRR
ncbi:hypothetical protein OEZ86_012434 [Tetradesmus obliquus]|nr:hypothetical protein OEZ86_012434 [Tetradesmus obliquus]